jgi:hypothetical protein
MSEDAEIEDTVIISTRTKAGLQRTIDHEAKLRDQTRSQALEQIIKFGLPYYLKRVPKKFQTIDDAA